jgi:hypothetical protein
LGKNLDVNDDNNNYGDDGNDNDDDDVYLDRITQQKPKNYPLHVKYVENRPVREGTSSRKEQTKMFLPCEY